MATHRAKGARHGSVPARPAVRTESHTRFKSPNRVEAYDEISGAPSTLPPPPFESEAAVVGLEWWLDAHMALASQLLWLEQLLDTVPESGAHAETVYRLVQRAEAVRDALYELYCDAADPRMEALVGRGAALERYVRGSYAWCVLVVGLLAMVTNGLRWPAGPDWSAAKRGHRHASEHYRGRDEGLRQAVAALPIELSSPVEPLRNLPQDLERLFSAAAELHGALGSRFA
jgi:hypothetical protein